MRRSPLVLVLALATLAPMAGRADDPTVVQNGSVVATIDADGATLTNSIVTRSWNGRLPVTRSIAGNGFMSSVSLDDFAITVGAVPVGSGTLLASAPPVAVAIEGGVRLTWNLSLGPALGVRREVELYEGIAGFRAQTTLEPLAPLVLGGYTLDEIATGPGDATIDAFRAGADWRSPGEAWSPQLSVGDPHEGDWRVRTEGRQVTAPGEWLSVAPDTGGRVAMVSERRDYASSRMSFGAGIARAVVDLSHDLVYTGPFEEDIHAENPGFPAGRVRVLSPGRPVPLEPSFTMLARDADDEPWQFARYLTEHRMSPYPHDVTFNTNGVDSRVLTDGAKDDVDYARFLTLADAARQMGVDTFILDDGWQAISGDWCPDSPSCPEPRWDGTPTSKYRPRFPDATFEAVRDVLDGDDADPTDDIALGLWMTPMEFHPSSAAFRANPQWACAPVGDGTAALSIADPDGGSNEAGIGVWNPLAIGVDPADPTKQIRLIDYIEGRIRRAIDVFGARFFKFDFLVWVDCGGVEPVDMYAYHDAFVAMVDRLIADYDGRDDVHPQVTFQTDETNDYRLFPFESVARGPSWFQNGSPKSHQLLHNVWNLAPYVPGSSLGQASLGDGGDRTAKGIDNLMAATLGSQVTFWNRIDTDLDDAQRAQVKRWTDFHAANPALGSFAYPLLDDPLVKSWTALQPWNYDDASGWLLAYRQESPDAARAIALRGLGAQPEGRLFTATLVDPVTGSETLLDTFSAGTLRTAGLPVSIGAANGYAIVRIEPAG
jgi:hypothetical protein